MRNLIGQFKLTNELHTAMQYMSLSVCVCMWFDRYILGHLILLLLRYFHCVV